MKTLQVHVRDMPDWALSIAAALNKSAKFVSNSIGKVVTYDTSTVSFGVAGAELDLSLRLDEMGCGCVDFP